MASLLTSRFQNSRHNDIYHLSNLSFYYFVMIVLYYWLELWTSKTKLVWQVCSHIRKKIWEMVRY